MKKQSIERADLANQIHHSTETKVQQGINAKPYKGSHENSVTCFCVQISPASEFRYHASPIMTNYDWSRLGFKSGTFVNCMPPQSWLAKAKSIHDLGNWFYLPKKGERWNEAIDEKRDDRTDANWVKKLQEPIPVADEFREYFGSKMHDSWVVAVERNDSQLVVHLDSIYGSIFARGLANFLGAPRAVMRWPVDLIAHDATLVRAARYDPKGNLRFSDLRKLKSDAPQSGDSFLADWFYQEDGRVQWIVDINAWSPSDG